MRMAPPNLLALGIFAVVFLVGIEAQQTFQFSSFSKIPQSLLNQLGSAQIENLKQQFNGAGGGGGGGNSIPTYQVGSPIGGGGGSPGQALQFSRFSAIPQAVLDAMPSDQVEQIRLALMGTGGGGVQTFQVPGQGGGQTTEQQTFQFSSFSQIPQSLLDQLSSTQIENIKRELTATHFTTETTEVTETTSSSETTVINGNTQTLQFSRFSEITESILDQFSSDQIEQIKVALQQGGTVQLPATVTTYSYTIPGGSNKRVNNALNVIFNYVAAGGFLTGVPPIDLLLIRFFMNMGPAKFC